MHFDTLIFFQILNCVENLNSKNFANAKIKRCKQYYKNICKKGQIDHVFEKCLLKNLKKMLIKLPLKLVTNNQHQVKY